MLTIVIADDEPISKRGIKSILDRCQQDYSIVGEAENGLEALDLVEKLMPDILITDIRMPHMDGLQLLRKVNSFYPGVRTIVISGYDDFEYVRQALRSEAMDYLLKPIKITELMDILEKASSIKEAEKSGGKPPGSSVESKRKVIQDTIHYIQKNYQSDISLSDMAQAARITPGHFSKLFKAEMRMGFQEYVTKTRIEKAKSYLVSSNIKIADIAEMVGYHDAKYFHALFKRTVGITPIQYRDTRGSPKKSRPG